MCRPRETAIAGMYWFHRLDWFRGGAATAVVVLERLVVAKLRGTRKLARAEFQILAVPSFHLRIETLGKPERNGRERLWDH